MREPDYEIHLYLPRAWRDVLARAATKKRNRSVASFLRELIAASPEVAMAAQELGYTQLPTLQRRWGGRIKGAKNRVKGKRHRKVNYVTPVAPVPDPATEAAFDPWGRPLEFKPKE